MLHTKGLVHCTTSVNNSWNSSALDSNPTIDVKGVFLDILKVFHKVCHYGLLFKLKSCGVGVELFSPLESYLKSHEQSVA